MPHRMLFSPLSPQRRRRYRLGLLWPAIITALLLAALLYLGVINGVRAEEPAAPDGPPPGMPVEAVEVMLGPAHRSLNAVGSLQANEEVAIAAEITGRVMAINFAEGEKVRKGQLLIRLDDSVATAERDRARASLGLSEANIRRAEILLKEQAISERERDEAYAQWRLDEATLRLSEAQLAKTRIHAPFDGTIGLRRISLGRYLQPGEIIATLTDAATIKVDFRVPEIYAESLAVGQNIEVMVDALPGRPFAGEVYAIDPQVDVNGRSLMLRARLANRDNLLRPGMFARINLLLTKNPEALLIPEQALLAEGRQQLVYRVVEGMVQAAPVSIGLRRDGLVEIVEGLQVGDTVITAGQLKVFPGMPVTIVPPSPVGNGG